ncbi:MAG: hypothetical protein H0V51_19015, partial [Chloroflexi bacterium]|nr:hypothetical protein [Chloroflexota bacterium]
TGLTEAFCRQFGYHAAPRQDRPSKTRPTPLDLVRRLLPKSWRVALSHHLPWTAQERLLSEELARSTDWARTTAFTIPSLYTGYIRVNLRGREPRGIVEPGPEYERLLDRVEADLARLVEPRTGQPAVGWVSRTARAFGTGPPTHLPDLFVEWASFPHFMDRALYPGGALLQPKPSYFRDNRHTLHGFVAAAGPSIRGRGSIGDLTLTDLAPTFLSLLGAPIPDGMRGKPLECLRSPSVP